MALFDHARVISNFDGALAWFELDIFSGDGVEHQRLNDHAARDEAIRNLGLQGYGLVTVTLENDRHEPISREHLWFRREV